MIQLTWPVQEQFGQLIKKKMMKLRNKNKNKNEEEKKAHHNEAM
jgi:hypothetical protein